MAATYPTHTPLTVEALWAEVCALAHDTTGRGQGVGVELSGGSWKLVAYVKPDAATLAALFLPLLAPLPADRPLVIAHLAQSLDGRIARGHIQASLEHCKYAFQHGCRICTGEFKV